MLLRWNDRIGEIEMNLTHEKPNTFNNMSRMIVSHVALLIILPLAPQIYSILVFFLLSHSHPQILSIIQF